LTGGEPTAESDDAACTAVLLSAPREVAERIGSFLRSKDIPCRIRPNEVMTPPRPAEESEGSTENRGRSEPPSLGKLIRGRLGRGRKAEIEVVDTDISPAWVLLVRPEDLPEGWSEGGDAEGPGPAATSPEAASEVAGLETAPEAGGAEPLVLCELAWGEAWRLTERLIAAGIPAAVMAGEGGDRDRPMSARLVPVGVRAEDLERARTFLA
jgi:hypothetical protein